MSNEIQVNTEQVEEDATVIESSASNFLAIALGTPDTTSTITANEKCKEAYNASQSNCEEFGAALSKDVANIRSLNVKFEEFDKMIGEMSRRVPSFTTS